MAQAEALRDQVSGVSLDEEAMKLMKFQRAYEANARFFQVIDETLESSDQHRGEVIAMRVTVGARLYRHDRSTRQTRAERLLEYQRQVSTGKRVSKAERRSPPRLRRRSWSAARAAIGRYLHAPTRRSRA